MQSLYDSPPSATNRIARPSPSSNYQGLRSVMSSPYLVSLGHPHNQTPNYHYHGEAWDMAAGSGAPPSRAMSSSALERLNDPYQSDPSGHNPQFSYRNRQSQSQPPIPQPHSPYQDNYDQYTEIGYGSASNSYRSSSNGGVEDEDYGIMIDTTMNMAGNYDMRRRKSLPLPGSASQPIPSAKTYNPNGYGHIGIPDPRAPAFIPGSYR
jgi:hypothetical protein